MGVNNRARRAAKKRKRAGREREARQPGTAYGSYRPDGGDPLLDPGPPPSPDEIAAILVEHAVTVVEGGEPADEIARELLETAAEHTPALVRAVRSHLAPAAAAAGHAGWTPHDLGELVRRRLGPAHRPLLAHLLDVEVRQHPATTVAGQWRDEVLALGRPADVSVRTVGGLTLALELAVLLGSVPVIPRLLAPPGRADALADAQRRAPAGGPDAKMLARVRGLLAKAESTEFVEEAEALSAKAQELVSRYSLERLIASAAHRDGAGAGEPIVSRRLWIDAPYVTPKAHLVHRVAIANRCSTIVAAKLGFTTVAGTTGDLDAVELLSTSLMVQADTAMLAAGRQVDRYGGSRTSSYRRSFLLAYADRIGERLTEADEAVASTAVDGGAGALVPLLSAHEARVGAALAELFPETVKRRPSVGNLKGWVEGRAAADAAELGVRPPLEQ